MAGIGKRSWVIADGYCPSRSSGDDPALISHEAACMLNPGSVEARVSFTVFFSDSEPLGPADVVIPPRRIRHQNLAKLPGLTVPHDTDYSVLIESDQPIVVQHTRLDSRQAENAIMSTIAFPGE
ncbi:MAG TPA: sensory rhodopsin transducer [Streptosporangiaceae bacterium]|nr:sensory rhodopsin transducer [Streptosporangiaceae bacterium]